MFYEIYNLLSEFIFNNNLPVFGESALTLVCTALCLAVCFIPFYVVIRVIKLICG